MILDSGLDAACQTLAANSEPYFNAWLNYAAFGTGSTAPAAGQTGLVSQVGSRSSANGGFSNALDAGTDAVNKVLWYEVTFTRVFSISGAVNATEWGLAAATTGNLSVRELFRADPNDNSSSPVTLTLDNGDELQLVVTFRVQAAWEEASQSFVVTGTAGNDTNGTHDGKGLITSGAGGSTRSEVATALRAVWPGGGGVAGYIISALQVWTSDQSSRTKSQDASASSAEVVLMSNAAYTPGTFYRDCGGTYGTSQANGTHYAWGVSAATSPSANTASRGYRFYLTSPTTLAKASTHKLTLTVRKSISRL